MAVVSAEMPGNAVIDIKLISAKPVENWGFINCKKCVIVTAKPLMLESPQRQTMMLTKTLCSYDVIVDLKQNFQIKTWF